MFVWLPGARGYRVTNFFFEQALIMRDTVWICGTHELGFKRCARTSYAGRVVTLVQSEIIPKSFYICKKYHLVLIDHTCELLTTAKIYLCLKHYLLNLRFSEKWYYRPCSPLIFKRDANGLIRFNDLCYAKSAPSRPGDWLNGFKNGKTQLFNSNVRGFIKKVECSFKRHLFSVFIRSFGNSQKWR